MIVPSIDQNQAVKVAAEYLRQGKLWLLVSLRSVPSDDPERSQALYEVAERKNILNKVKQDDPLIGQILEYRLVKEYSTQRTLDELEQQGNSMAERTLRRKQHKGLLMVYSLMPSTCTTIAK